MRCHTCFSAPSVVFFTYDHLSALETDTVLHKVGEDLRHPVHGQGTAPFCDGVDALFLPNKVQILLDSSNLPGRVLLHSHSLYSTAVLLLLTSTWLHQLHSLL
jgi:hypothetical protein